MECSLPWEVVFVGTGPLEGVAEPSVTAELLRAWRTTEGKKKKKNAREKKQHGDIFYSHLWWSDTRCPRVSRWRGGKQWALDWWGTGSPPAPDQRPEHLHRSCCRRNPPVQTHTHTHTHTKETSPSPLDWNSWSSSAPQVCFYLQHACTFSLDGAVWRHVQFVHRLLTAAAK